MKSILLYSICTNGGYAMDNSIDETEDSLMDHMDMLQISEEEEEPVNIEEIIKYVKKKLIEEEEEEEEKKTKNDYIQQNKEILLQQKKKIEQLTQEMLAVEQKSEEMFIKEMADQIKKSNKENTERKFNIETRVSEILRRDYKYDIKPIKQQQIINSIIKSIIPTFDIDEIITGYVSIKMADREKYLFNKIVNTEHMLNQESNIVQNNNIIEQEKKEEKIKLMYKIYKEECYQKEIELSLKKQIMQCTEKYLLNIIYNNQKKQKSNEETL